MDEITQRVECANMDITAGDVYRCDQKKIEVLAVSETGDIIWYDDGTMAIITLYAERDEFLSLIDGMQKVA